jgi:hypothetical protein
MPVRFLGQRHDLAAEYSPIGMVELPPIWRVGGEWSGLRKLGRREGLPFSVYPSRDGAALLRR